MRIKNRKKHTKKSKKKKKKDKKSINVDDILLENRQLFLYGEIKEKQTKELSKKMIALNRLNKKPITLYINSIGGDVAGGIALIDIIKNIRCPVFTFIIGEACSMAGLISVVGDKRFITKNSIWMAHPMSGGMGSDYFHVYKDRLKGLELYVKSLKKVLKEHTKLMQKDINKIERGEMWLTAEECLKKGIVDEIV